MSTERNGDTERAPPLTLTEQDADELTQPDIPRPESHWDRVLRMLRHLTNKVNEIGDTQIKQLEVAANTCRRLDAIEQALKEKKP